MRAQHNTTTMITERKGTAMSNANQSFVSLLKPASLTKPAARLTFHAAARHVRPSRTKKTA